MALYVNARLPRLLEATRDPLQTYSPVRTYGRRSQPDRYPRYTSMVAQDGPCVSVPPRMATWDLSEVAPVVLDTDLG